MRDPQPGGRTFAGETEVGGMNGYICLWKGLRVEVYAETTFAAQQAALSMLQAKAGRRKVKRYDVSVTLCEKDGEPVVHVADF